MPATPSIRTFRDAIAELTHSFNLVDDAIPPRASC